MVYKAAGISINKSATLYISLLLGSVDMFKGYIKLLLRHNVCGKGY